MPAMFSRSSVFDGRWTVTTNTPGFTPASSGSGSALCDRAVIVHRIDHHVADKINPSRIPGREVFTAVSVGQKRISDA